MPPTRAKADMRRSLPERIEPEPRSIEPVAIEIDTRNQEGLDAAVEEVIERVANWAHKGVSTKVRLKFGDKPLLPPIPLALFIVAEVATFWFAGLLRAAVLNIGGRALLEVEVVSATDPYMARGKEFLLKGEVAEAREWFHRALEVDRFLPGAHYHIGVCFKLSGERRLALAAFQRALDLDPHGTSGLEARDQIDKLRRTARR